VEQYVQARENILMHTQTRKDQPHRRTVLLLSRLDDG